ncbi:MAG: glycosyltransferase [Desulfobacterium sp.]|nr:glycosyltransferase [Desulfobacterium sp.]
MKDKLMQGELLFSQGRLDEAFKIFKEIVQLQTDNKQAFNNLGVISFNLDKIDVAVGFLTQAIDIDPTYKDAIINLADILRSANALYEIRSILENAIERLPEDRELLQLLAEVPMNKSSKKLAILCLPGLENFLGDIVDYLKDRYEVRICYSNKSIEIDATVKWADVVWIEWANEIAVALTGAPALIGNKQIICRLHSYEALAGYAAKIDWNRISDLIFVAKHIKNIVLNQVPDLETKVGNTHIVPNGINLDKFPFKTREKGKNVAFVGYLNYKKGPMLLLHAFNELVKADKEYKLYVAGQFQDARYQFYFSQMIRENGLEKNIIIEGWIDDIATWLEDKQYIVCTSVLEGHPVGLMEAMARGIKPLIHNFVGARGIYPKRYIWNSISEFVAMVLEDHYDSAEYREFIVRNFSLKRQLKAFDDIIAGKEPEVFQLPGVALERNQARTAGGVEWVFPENVFSQDLDVRIQALKDEAVKQLTAQKFDLAETSLDRLTKLTGYSDDTVIRSLVQLYQKKDYIPGIQQAWKRAAVSALEREDLDKFLEYCYISIYSENFYAKNPNYNYAVINEDINSYIALAARSHPLFSWVKKHRKPYRPTQENSKMRVGFVLEGFSQYQAPIRAYFPFAEHYDSNKFELYFYSRWCMEEEMAKKEGYQISAEHFQKHGCRAITPENRLTPTQQVEFLTKQIVNDRIDILVFQTTYFVPVYNFISCLHPAVFQAAISHQQPEYSHELDLEYAPDKAIMESPSKVGTWPTTLTKKNVKETNDRGIFQIEESAIVLISANREVRYQSSIFWKEMLIVLNRHPDAYFIPLGLSEDGLKKCIPHEAIPKNIITVGFRNDVMHFLNMSDIYIDIFPSGGGSSLAEAMTATLPIVTFQPDYSTLFSINKETVPTLWGIPKTDLLIPVGGIEQWHTVVDKLILNKGYREEMGKVMGAAADKLDPKSVSLLFMDRLKKAYFEKHKNI